MKWLFAPLFSIGTADSLECTLLFKFISTLSISQCILPSCIGWPYSQAKLGPLLLTGHVYQLLYGYSWHSTYVFKLYYGCSWHWQCKSMTQHKTVVTPLLTHWSYGSLALSHQHMLTIKLVWPSCPKTVTGVVSVFTSCLMLALVLFPCTQTCIPCNRHGQSTYAHNLGYIGVVCLGKPPLGSVWNWNSTAVVPSIFLWNISFRHFCIHPIIISIIIIIILWHNSFG